MRKKIIILFMCLCFIMVLSFNFKSNASSGYENYPNETYDLDINITFYDCTSGVGYPDKAEYMTFDHNSIIFSENGGPYSAGYYYFKIDTLTLNSDKMYYFYFTHYTSSQISAYLANDNITKDFDIEFVHEGNSVLSEFSKFTYTGNQSYTYIVIHFITGFTSGPINFFVEELDLNVGAKDTIRELNVQLEELQNTINSLNTQIVELENELKSLNLEKQQLQNELNISNGDKEELQNTINDLNTQIAGLENELESMNSEKQQLEDNIIDLKIQIEELENKTDSLFAKNKIAIVASAVSGLILVIGIVAFIVFFKRKD